MTDLILSGSVETPSSLTTCPKYLISFLKKSHFEGFNFKLAAFNFSKTALSPCEGTEYYVLYLFYCSPMLIPRQLRFSLYSGAVITEGRCSSFTFYCSSCLDLVLCLMPNHSILQQGCLLSGLFLDLVFPSILLVVRILSPLSVCLL